MVAACVVLVGLAFAQEPGFIVPDTKTDLAVAPEVLLSRAAHLWDAVAAGGQLQNQAYGYFWPIGPFFWVGSVLDIQPWAVQRAWLALVLCVAFLGTALLVRALGVRSDVAVILAGIAYALSPRMLSVLGSISIEAWPGALVPWVLLPLVVGSSRGSPRRAAALSAVAVATVGGVNAAATFSVIPLAAVWLLTRAPGPRRRTMMLWWPVFVLVGTLWWLVPLFVLGAYSPPFLDFIESAANTTFSTTLFDSLRGTSNWVPYVDVSAKAGNDLIRLFHLPVLSGVVLLLGVVGLLHPRNQHRQFLALGLAVGMLMVTAGHLGVVHGWGAGPMQSVLDGVLAPLRNVHKFDPIIRLPLVIGLAWTVDEAWQGLQARRTEQPDLEERARRLQLRVLVVTAVIAVIGASMPAYTGRITPNGFLSVPDYWQETADWLEERDDDGLALLAPGSSFGVYAWGNPRDEPMQFLAQSRWAVRNAVPLTPPGNIRMLDAVERRFAQGLGSAGLAPYLQRAGIGYLVVRNDLAKLPDNPDTVLVHQALRNSPGLRRVATFGPDVGGEAHLDTKGQRVLINGGWQSEYPAVEIFEVEAGGDFATEAGAPTRVVGGPEDLLDLADLGVVGEQPTLLANDAATESAPGSVVLTDGQRSIERSFGRVHDGASETRVPGQTRRLGSPTPDYLLPGAARWSTTAYVEGAASVTASSSMSDASAVGTNQPGEQPYAAIDGRDETTWRANFRPDQQAWWRVDLEKPRRVDCGPDHGWPDAARGGSRPDPARALRRGRHRTRAPPARSEFGDAETDFVRVEDASDRPGNRLTLSEVEVPDVAVRRGLRLPRLPDVWGTPDTIALRAVSDARRGCAEVDGDVRCVGDRDVAGEEEFEFQRRFDLPDAETYRTRIEADVRPGSALARAVLAQQPVNVTASSTGTPDPRASVLAAVDGDARTTWTADQTDDEPLLSLSWVDPPDGEQDRPHRGGRHRRQGAHAARPELAGRPANGHPRQHRGRPVSGLHGPGDDDPRARHRAGQQLGIRLLPECCAGGHHRAALDWRAVPPCGGPHRCHHVAVRRRSHPGGQRGGTDHVGADELRGARAGRARGSVPVRVERREPGRRRQRGRPAGLGPLRASLARARWGGGAGLGHRGREQRRDRPGTPHARADRPGGPSGRAREREPGVERNSGRSAAETAGRRRLAAGLVDHLVGWGGHDPLRPRSALPRGRFRRTGPARAVRGPDLAAPTLRGTSTPSHLGPCFSVRRPAQVSLCCFRACWPDGPVLPWVW